LFGDSFFLKQSLIVRDDHRLTPPFFERLIPLFQYGIKRLFVFLVQRRAYKQL
jgi:hypothetical protein